jgi:hypothetical protein
MPSTEKLDTHHKALTLNLDATTFGSFAEIGAGQEVARWFLVVGGASGTVAKTISAYDKEVPAACRGARREQYKCLSRTSVPFAAEFDCLAQAAGNGSSPARGSEHPDSNVCRNP